MVSQYGIGSDHWPGVSKLIEEMGEVNQVLGKLLGTRGKPNHWDGSDLLDRLHEELGDLEAAIAFLKFANNLDSDRIQNRRIDKLVLFMHWHHEQTKPPTG